MITMALTMKLSHFRANHLDSLKDKKMQSLNGASLLTSTIWIHITAMNWLNFRCLMIPRTCFTNNFRQYILCDVTTAMLDVFYRVMFLCKTVLIFECNNSHWWTFVFRFGYSNINRQKNSTKCWSNIKRYYQFRLKRMSLHWNLPAHRCLIQMHLLIHRPIVSSKSLPQINHNSCILLDFIRFCTWNFRFRCSFFCLYPLCSWGLLLDFILEFVAFLPTHTYM